MLITELGAGDPLAESLCSVAFADAYHLSMGGASWAALMISEKEVFLRRATRFMGIYSGKWAGVRKTATQALDWPRNYVPRSDVAIDQPITGYYYGGLVTYDYAAYLLSYYANDSLPRQVVQACAELALKAIAGDLQADVGPQVREEMVGPIRVSYEPGARQSPKYVAIETMLAPFFMRRQSIQMERA